MKKLLVIYLLLLFTACNENRATHPDHHPADKRCLLKTAPQKQEVADPALVLSVIVNREIALHESTSVSPDEDTDHPNGSLSTSPF